MWQSAEGYISLLIFLKVGFKKISQDFFFIIGLWLGLQFGAQQRCCLVWRNQDLAFQPLSVSFLTSNTCIHQQMLCSKARWLSQNA